MMRRSAIIGAALLALTATAAQAADKTGAAERAVGKQVFEKWCAPCHAPNPRLAGTLALQHKYEGQLPAALEARTDLTPEIVATFVRMGVAWMAPFRKTEISDTELAALGAYLSKPSPPKKETQP